MPHPLLEALGLHLFTTPADQVVVLAHADDSSAILAAGALRLETAVVALAALLEAVVGRFLMAVVDAAALAAGLAGRADGLSLRDADVELFGAECAVALRAGPRRANQFAPLVKVLRPDSALRTEWKGDLLGGVTVIKGTWSDGSALTAIPYYARSNRPPEAPKKARPTVRSSVWLKDR